MRLRPVSTRFGGWTAAFLALVLLPLTILTLGGGTGAVVLAAGVYLASALIALLGMEARYPHDRVGTANTITLLRLALIASLMVPIVETGVDPGLAWLMTAITLLALTLDGVDGFFARRENLVSGFGGRFDVEVDSAFALALSVLAYQFDKAGIWVLMLGLPRYLFVGAGLIWPWLRAPLPERFSRKLVCVIQIAVLIGLLAPIIVPPVSLALAAIATCLVVWSFALDVVWLARHRS